MISKEEFILRSRQVHGWKYDYSKVNYNKVTDKVCIICPEHGEFWMEARSHYRGQGCPRCGIESRAKKRSYDTEKFIQKAKELYGDKYDYSEVDYVGSQTKVKIKCPEHGYFWKKPTNFLLGHNCPQCGEEVMKEKLSMPQEEFIERVKALHNNKYDYSKVKYINQREKIKIICPIHGEFEQGAGIHLNGRGCPLCARETQAERQLKTTEWFIERARAVHGDKYDYSKTKYIGINRPLTITCPKHGDFIQKASIHLSGCGCKKCWQITSHYEDELYEYIGGLLSNDVKIERDNREILDGNRSLDIYIPEYKIAFEFDGLYWHNEKNKPDKNYHLNKTRECLEHGIQLIHIFEDEWVYKKDICKSRIKNLLHCIENRVYARKCEVREITNKEGYAFCEENHIQGGVASKYNLGLFYGNELVSVMTFGNLRKNLGSTSKDNQYELLRFCSKIGYSVIGGADKLFKHFIREHNPSRIISYVDRRWSNGNLYEKLGFRLDHYSQPNYFYVFGDTKKNRFSFRKDILIEKYGCPKEMSEHEFCLSQQWYRIYDCGCFCYIWEK